MRPVISCRSWTTSLNYKNLFMRDIKLIISRFLFKVFTHDFSVISVHFWLSTHTPKEKNNNLLIRIKYKIWSNRKKAVSLVCASNIFKYFPNLYFYIYTHSWVCFLNYQQYRLYTGTKVALYTTIRCVRNKSFQQGWDWPIMK